VVGVHGIGGFVGMIGIGLLASKTVNDLGGEGLFISGDASLLGKQLIASLSVAAFSFTATWLIATAIQKSVGFRVNRNLELEGLDTTQHAESAYDINPFTTR
jgi:Amt family ammonium transporter